MEKGLQLQRTMEDVDHLDPSQMGFRVGMEVGKKPYLHLQITSSGVRWGGER